MSDLGRRRSVIGRFGVAMLATSVLLLSPFLAGCDDSATPTAAGNDRPSFGVSTASDGRSIVVRGSGCWYDSSDLSSQVYVRATGAGHQSRSISRPVDTDGSWHVAFGLDGEPRNAILILGAECGASDTMSSAGPDLAYTLKAAVAPARGAATVDMEIPGELTLTRGTAAMITGPSCVAAPDFRLLLEVRRVVEPPTQTGPYTARYDPAEQPWNFSFTTAAQAEKPGVVFRVPTDLPADEYTMSCHDVHNAIVHQRTVTVK
jgi:hypothetical protein